MTGEYGRDRETVAGVATKSTACQMNATFTAGIIDAVDVFVHHGVNKNLDVDVGFKKGLNDAEIDNTLRAGVTMRF